MSSLTPGHFAAHFHIHSVLTGKVPLPTWTRVWGLFLFDQAVADFEQGLTSILTDSVVTPELDASFEEPDGIASLVSSGFLPSVSTISVASKLQLAPSIKSHKLWCQATALPLPVPMAEEISASKLIQYFPVIQQQLGSSLLHHLITSHWILPIGRWIRVCLIFGLAVVWLLMPFLIWSSLFVIPE